MEIRNSTKFNTYKKNDESGYEIELKVKKVSNDYFVGQITEVKDIILKQIEEYDTFMSWHPLDYSKEFLSVASALEYIGTDKIEHPLKDEKMILLNVGCNDTGEIECIILENDYEYREYRLSIWNYVFTDKYGENFDIVKLSSHSTNSSDYKYSTSHTGTGADADIIISSPNELGIVNINAYFVKEEIVSSINLISEDGDTEKGLEVLNEILEMY